MFRDCGEQTTNNGSGFSPSPPNGKVIARQRIEHLTMMGVEVNITLTKLQVNA
jgi:hypothetical protein